ncbi:MAG: hypothetical protein ACRD16_09920, partial [Thermoanaerobaculia bacterium]
MAEPTPPPHGQLRRGADGPIAIVTALPEELRPLRRRARDLKAEKGNGLRLWRGLLGRAPVALACTGDGNRNAEARAATLLDLVRPSALIGAGVAGALSADLSPGQIVYGDRIFGPSGEAPAAASDWRERVRALPGATPA